MLVLSRELGRPVGSDRLIQAGLDALLAGIDAPSLPLLAGLGRREESDAPELFDHVVDELGIEFQPPADPTAASWALAYLFAVQITDGAIDPATGAYLIWVEVAMRLGCPNELQPIVDCAMELELHASGETRDISLDRVEDDIHRAVQALLSTRWPRGLQP